MRRKPIFIERCSCGATMEFWRCTPEEADLIRFRREHICPNRRLPVTQRKPVNPDIQRILRQRMRG